MRRPRAERGEAPPRLGFLGVGWIGRHRLEAVCGRGAAVAAAIADPDEARLELASTSAPGARRCRSLEELLALDLDGVVIATPSALHAEQAVAALERGLPVFCQKPLGRSCAEAAAVVAVARRADRLLGVDLSYRHLVASGRLRELIAAGELGTIFAGRLCFHNAYGPDQAWFYDARLSGGGCVIDLGTHLVDLASWLLGGARVAGVSARCFAGGRPLPTPVTTVEDYAVARLDLEGGAAVELTCSWGLHAGQDALIEASFWGERGGVRMGNVAGSFYDFQAERLDGTTRRLLVEPPDDWGGRALEDWARSLAAGRSFDPAVESVVGVAAVIDRIYGRLPEAASGLQPPVASTAGAQGVAVGRATTEAGRLW